VKVFSGERPAQKRQQAAALHIGEANEAMAIMADRCVGGSVLTAEARRARREANRKPCEEDAGKKLLARGLVPGQEGVEEAG